MQSATTPSGTGPPGREQRASLARRRLGLRLLGALLVGLWAGVALVVLVGYRPGGPWDVAVAGAAFMPTLVALVAVAWPPVARSWRRAAAVAWLGIGAALLVAPLAGLVITQLATGGGRTLLPSTEMAYAAVLAAGASSLFASLGIIAARDGRGDPDGPGAALSRPPSVFGALSLAVILTTLMSVAFGGAALANELALREVPPPPSRYGPTDPALPNPMCDTPMAIGPGATLEITAQAFIDDEPAGSAWLTGRRSGTDETWQGGADGPSGDVVSGYTRVGDRAWLLTRGTWQPSEPDPFGMLGLSGLTVDGPVAVAVVRPERPPVAEDVGLELIAGAKARHCRMAIDGPTALATMVPVRWLVGADATRASNPLTAWRGTLDWWVFADGQLGQAQLVLNGYPGEAWPASGVQGEIHARMTAIDRAFLHQVAPPLDASTEAP